jgi:hypothetical protein
VSTYYRQEKTAGWVCDKADVRLTGGGRTVSYIFDSGHSCGLGGWVDEFHEQYWPPGGYSHEEAGVSD